MKKDELIKECVRILTKPKVSRWYEKNLEGKLQVETINSLEMGVSSGELSIREALAIALIVGFQWTEKFEGVP